MSEAASYTISIVGQDIAFACAADETIIAAAERAGFALPYSCRKGACATCAGGLAEGEVALPDGQRVRAPAEEVLLCRAAPRSDIALRPQRIESRAQPSRKRLPAKVFRIAQAGNVTLLHLRFAAGNRIKFKAGQSLRLHLFDGETRLYSIASPPQESDGVQLHIERIDGGAFSARLLDALRIGDRLDIELPFGDFFLRDGPADKPILLLAAGTGLAPMKSMIEDMIKRRLMRPLFLYWGTRRIQDLYTDLPDKWAARHTWLGYRPVLSKPEPGWSGRTGLVHMAALEDHADLSRMDVYAAGNPVMIRAARALFLEKAGLPPASFYSEAFVASGTYETQPA